MILKDRLFTVVALFFAAGIAVGFVASPGGRTVCFLVLCALSLAAAGLSALVKRRFPDRKNATVFVLTALLALTVGTGWAHLREQPYAEKQAFCGKQDVLVGTVTDSGSTAGSKWIAVRAERSRIALPAGTGVRVLVSSPVRLLCGDRVTLDVKYGSLCDESGRADRLALFADGTLVSREYADDLFGILRRKGVSVCEKLYAPYGQQGLTEALLFREKSAVGTDANEVYRGAGLSHLLAISGLHLIILITFLRKILEKCGVSAWAGDLICVVASVAYAVLVGASPSVLRAVCMLSAVTVGTRLFKSVDGVSSLSVALTLLLIANPYALFSVGLQLSFLSCLGILLLEPYAERLREHIIGEASGRKKKLRGWVSAVAEHFLVSMGAVLFTFPVLAFTFSQVSWIAPLVNLLVVPLFPYVLTLVLLSVLVCPLWNGLGTVIAFLPGKALQGLQAGLTFLHGNGVGSISLPEKAAVVPAIFCCAGLFGFAFLKKHRFRVVCTAGLLFVVSTVVLALLPC